MSQNVALCDVSFVVLLSHIPLPQRTALKMTSKFGFAGSTMMIKTGFAVTVFFLAVLAAAAAAEAAPCLIVTLTGTQSGPPADIGLAGAGTLVSYGDDANNCGAVKLQFDAGRGTTMRLSQVGVSPGQLNAIFFTHMHSDHVDGFADIVQLRWHMNSPGPKIDVVCSSDAASVLGFTVSCRKFIAHIGDSLFAIGRNRPAPFREQGTSTRWPRPR